jgi:CubicO group peptidase (beta-lactamase class C family)
MEGRPAAFSCRKGVNPSSTRRSATMIRRAPLLGTAAFLLAGPVVAAGRDTRIDRVFAAHDKPDSPGCAVVVLHRGEIIHRRGHGLAHLEHGAPITPSTVFHVASLAKQFTALAVCLLAEDGKLTLDDDVRKHLPELPDWGHVVTLRHLLHHTSGLHDATELFGYAGWRPGDLVTDRDYLDFALRQKALDFRPGDRHVYGNTGYVLAGLVVRKVSGQSLRAFCDARVFKPLGMRSSHFHDDHAEVVKGRASAYALRGGRLRIAVPRFDTVGSTGLFTTADDLARWGRNLDDPRVGKAALGRMLTPGRLNGGEAIRYGRELGYGLGLVVGRHRGLRTVSHSGADLGYRAELLHFPGQRLTVILLGNLESLQPFTLARQVADVCLAGELPPEEAKRPERTAAPSERELAAWAGTYWSLRTGVSWTFSVKGGKLRIGRRELTPLASDRFRIGDLPIELVFSPAKGAAPRRLTWRDVDDEEYVAVPDLDKGKIRLADYAGTYRSDELSTAFTLAVRGGELVARGWRDELGPLRPVLADGFSLRPPGLAPAFVRFLRDGRGDVLELVLSTERCEGVRFVKTAR